VSWERPCQQRRKEGLHGCPYTGGMSESTLVMCPEQNIRWSSKGREVFYRTTQSTAA